MVTHSPYASIFDAQPGYSGRQTANPQVNIFHVISTPGAGCTMRSLPLSQAAMGILHWENNPAATHTLIPPTWIGEPEQMTPISTRLPIVESGRAFRFINAAIGRSGQGSFQADYVYVSVNTAPASISDCFLVRVGDLIAGDFQRLYLTGFLFTPAKAARFDLGTIIGATPDGIASIIEVST